MIYYKECRSISENISYHGNPLTEMFFMFTRSETVAAYFFSESLRVFQIQLKQCLNMITGEGYRHQKYVLPALSHQALDGIICLRGQPRQRAHLEIYM